MSRNRLRVDAALIGTFGLAWGLGTPASGTVPYTPVAGPFPGFGPGVIDDDLVGGKEYSHDFDSTSIGGPAVGPPPADPQQIIAWDGIGGVVDVTDYTGTRIDYTPDDQIDAIANRRDFAYEELKADVAHLVFSVDDFFTLYSFGAPTPAVLPAAGPVVLANGNVIGGAGEYSFEESTSFGNAPDTQGLWAAQAEVNAMPVPDDVDGLEVWGPEPPLADADKYSLDLDVFSTGVLPGPDAVSVWNASGTPYVPHSAVVAAVTSLLGPIPPTAFLPLPGGGLDGEEAINLDALMVQDIIEDPDRFDGDPAGLPGDEIIFSIRQIIDPLDPDGYYATGSELIVLNASGSATYLAHGGHLWDHTYALTTFDVFFMDPQNFGVIDINAIEAIGEFAIPEPASLALIGLAGVGCVIHRRREAG